MRIIISSLFLLSFGFLFPGNAIEASDPTLTIVYPAEGETISTDEILLTFSLKGIPLDGSYILNVECMVVEEVTGTNKLVNESEPSKNISLEEYYWDLPITSNEVTVPVTLFLNNKYRVRGYITEKENTAAPVVADEQNFFVVDLPTFEQEKFFLTPDSGTLDGERLEITVSLEDEEIDESDIQIFYRVSKNTYYPGEYEVYENKIVLEEHGNYWVGALIKVRGYSAFEVSGRYFIDQSDHSPSLTLVIPDSERIIRDGNVMFYFSMENAIWNGDYKIYLSVVPLPDDNSDPYYSEGEVFEIPVTSTTSYITRYLPNYKYSINASLCKKDGECVAEIEPIEIIVEELRLSQEDIIVTPSTTVIDDRIEVTINLREGLPKIDTQYVWYSLCNADDNCTTPVKYEGIIGLEEHGEYYIKFEIIVKEYIPYQMVVGPYTIQKGGSDISEFTITKWYVQNKVLYLSVTSGDLVEVFTTQGIKLYSSYVFEELVSIPRLPENQLLLVKVNNEILKVSLK